MPIELLAEGDNNIVHVRMSGRLSTKDYERYLSELERLIAKRGKIRLLAEIDDYQGLDMGAWWEDTKFGIHHARDVERVAVVGGPKWWEAVGKFVDALGIMDNRSFEPGQEEEARRWVESTEE